VVVDGAQADEATGADGSASEQEEFLDSDYEIEEGDDPDKAGPPISERKERRGAGDAAG